MDETSKLRITKNDDVSIKTIATSKQFTFIVGADETEFTIHSALVAKQSQVLYALVNGKFKESLEGCVKWPDVQEATFTSFWEFVYTGDYSSPQVNNGEDSGNQDDELSLWEGSMGTEYTQLFQEYSDHDSEAPEHPHMSILWYAFVKAWAPQPQPRALDHCKVCPELLMHHARVYIFADYYGLDRLMEVSLGRLFLALEVTFPRVDTWVRVMELLSFTFENPVPEELQRLVAHYVACYIETFQSQGEFQDLMQNPECSMKDLVEEVVSRYKRNF